MKFLIALLVIILLIVIVSIFYFEAYGTLNDIRIKMNNANDNITSLLKEKYSLMQKLYEIIKKNIKKKDYLKDFSALSKQNLSNYELDAELNTHLKTMTDLKEDYKSLNNKEYNDLLKQAKKIDQDIVANKKFFNKNNNQLIKALHGYKKVVAKLLNINVKTSYEIKKPID